MIPSFKNTDHVRKAGIKDVQLFFNQEHYLEQVRETAADYFEIPKEYVHVIESSTRDDDINWEGLEQYKGFKKESLGLVYHIIDKRYLDDRRNDMTIMLVYEIIEDLSIVFLYASYSGQDDDEEEEYEPPEENVLLTKYEIDTLLKTLKYVKYEDCNQTDITDD